MALAAICTPWANILTDNADGAGMQAHLHAIFEARDLLYDDEYAALRMSPLFAFVTERGVVSNHWPAGASFLQAPGWLLGRLAGLVLVGEGVSERAATWTLPLLGLRCWAMLVLAWLIARVHRWLCAHVDKRSATLTCAALVLGTPLLYYAAESPLRPHLWGAAVVAVLTMRWFDAIEHAVADPERAAANLRRPVELAIYAGLATAVRPQLAILAVLVAHERWVASAEMSVRDRLGLLARHGAVSGAAFLVWPLVVLRMQIWMYGASSLGDYGGEVTHHLRAFLLSTHHGALVWCPVLVLGLLGLAIGAAGRQRGAIVLLGLVAVQIWLDAGTREIEPYRVLGTRTWTGGTAFGPRKLLDAVPLMLPGVVWLSRWLEGQAPIERRRWQLRLGAATLLAMVPTTLLLAAAIVDPNVCSTIMDGDRLVIALGLGFDPGNWAQAWAQRALPLKISVTIAAVVGVPLATLVVLELRRAVPVEGWGRRARWPWMLALVIGLGAHAWLLHLEQRSQALLVADPGRMPRAAAQMNAWHVATVAEIPRHQALLRARLGVGGG
ncbi:hypothetical protein DB30_02225 [Enhygromyxa salina]|uniref:Glycosyltransferase RgtA/B/C/D-like domain-containing protein n=1 Tax=Enhygromyxa salina TaxID=215803 RepID=A0A0C1Z330_9BACT|nr:hypothetical protein [Enhygromyxa salina]KIG11979.1 hypothetical protein DB30_02225 [Enhygromyxa salina]